MTDLEINKKDYQLSFTIAILLSLCLIGLWYLLITNMDIYGEIFGPIDPIYAFLVAGTIVAVIMILLMVKEGYNSYRESVL